MIFLFFCTEIWYWCNKNPKPWVVVDKITGHFNIIQKFFGFPKPGKSRLKKSTFFVNDQKFTSWWILFENPHPWKSLVFFLIQGLREVFKIYIKNLYKKSTSLEKLLKFILKNVNTWRLWNLSLKNPRP